MAPALELGTHKPASPSSNCTGKVSTRPRPPSRPQEARSTGTPRLYMSTPFKLTSGDALCAGDETEAPNTHHGDLGIFPDRPVQSRRRHTMPALPNKASVSSKKPPALTPARAASSRRHRRPAAMTTTSTPSGNNDDVDTGPALLDDSRTKSSSGN